MTAIVGIANGRNIWIGGDSAGISGWSLTTRADPKVFIAHGFIYGFTTSFRMGDILRYRFVPPPIEKGIDLRQYLASDWIDGIRSAFQKGGFAKKDKDEESGGTFLIGIDGHLFRVDTDFQVAESCYGYDAIGAGAELALGALFALESSEAQPPRLPPRARISLALLAAERHCAAVRSPFLIKELNP